MATDEHAIVSIHDRTTTCTIYRHEHGQPHGPEGVIASVRDVCRTVVVIDAESIGNCLHAKWRPKASAELSEQDTWFDPRYWYEVEEVRGRLLLTIHDLGTWGSEARTIPVTECEELS